MYREINKSECIGRKIKTFVGPMQSKIVDITNTMKLQIKTRSISHRKRQSMFLLTFDLIVVLINLECCHY